MVERAAARPRRDTPEAAAQLGGAPRIKLERRCLLVRGDARVANQARFGLGNDLEGHRAGRDAFPKPSLPPFRRFRSGTALAALVDAQHFGKRIARHGQDATAATA